MNSSNTCYSSTICWVSCLSSFSILPMSLSFPTPPSYPCHSPSLHLRPCPQRSPVPFDSVACLPSLLPASLSSFTSFLGTAFPPLPQTIPLSSSVLHQSPAYAYYHTIISFSSLSSTSHLPLCTGQRSFSSPSFSSPSIPSHSSLLLQSILPVTSFSLLLSPPRYIQTTEVNSYLRCDSEGRWKSPRSTTARQASSLHIYFSRSSP